MEEVSVIVSSGSNTFYCSHPKATYSIIDTTELNYYNQKAYSDIPTLVAKYKDSSFQVNCKTIQPISLIKPRTTSNQASRFSLLPYGSPSRSKTRNSTETIAMCRARITTYRLCGCIHKHIDLCSIARKASTAMEWDSVHVCSDWDKASTEVYESVVKRCPSHAKEFLERAGNGNGNGHGGGR